MLAALARAARPKPPRLALRAFSSALAPAEALRLAAPGNFVRFVAPTGGVHWGTLTDDKRAQPLEEGADLFSGEPKAADVEPLEIAQLLAPLPLNPPPAIPCLGPNYHAHAKETGIPVPRFPVIFYKSPASPAAPGEPVAIPKCASAKPEIDFEAELAFVIGKSVKNATLEEALDAVLGITAANDVSARRWQGKKGGGQWCYSKSFDGFCPVGPSLMPMASARERLGGEGLRLRGLLDGKEMQTTLTSDMIFSVADIVRFLSDGTTLLPGTLVLTGTPSGVGFTRKPPSYLAAGNVTTVELEGVGALSNPIA